LWYYRVFAEALTGDSEKAPQYFNFFYFQFIIAALFQSLSHRAARQCFLYYDVVYAVYRTLALTFALSISVYLLL